MIQRKTNVKPISLVIEQRKNEFDRMANVRFYPSIVMPREDDTCQYL
jgi:hypothetical protein